ncbi:sodium-dependent glucose transporter 1-like [Bradysia coprophila]|uniref:sodium-dependent glucose transporter 1-like n=1 Tax=Bradysia coprophila TaxID=38358 RepID=UPI00187DB45E|nr:sodium-dependent glucose transporter 1-like [Bradysia coprophila]
MAEKLTVEEGKKPQPQPLSGQIKILTTSAILLGNLTFGCSLNSFSPALDNMRSKYETTIEDISVIFTVTTIMYCCGATICGFISHYMNRQLIVIIALSAMTMSMYMTPYCPDKSMFFVSGGILGFSTGFYDSAQMVWMIEIWQNKAGPFIQAQSLFYGIGSIIPSVLIAPFLQKYDHFNVGLNRTDSSPVETSTLHIPFLMIGALDSLALAFQLFLFTFYRYHTPPMYANENFEMIDDAKNVPSQIEPELKDKNASINQQENVAAMGVSSRKIKLVAVTVLFLGVYQAMEVSTMQFLPTFGQYSDLKMTESASSYVLTGLIGMSCIGRLIGAIIIIKVRPELIIFINFIFVITGNSILLIWANDNLPMFWLGSMILGMGFSTIFPGFCAFMEKYLVLTTSIASSVLVFGSLVSSIYPFIIGKFIERHAVVLTYTNLFSTSAGIVVMIWGYKSTRNIVSRVR